MKLFAACLVAGLLAPAAFAQEAPATPAAPPAASVTDKVTISEMREGALKSQQQAEQTANEARRAFQGINKGQGDRTAGCSLARQADLEYITALAEARKVYEAADAGLVKDGFKQRVEGMTERRKNLADFADRICKGNGMGPMPGKGLGKGLGDRPRPRN